MPGRRSYMLKEGTVLDDRYVVGDVLGMGGFGIVYRCGAVLTGETVCVKEFFCRDYMTRDTAIADEVHLIDPEDRERFEAEKARFLKEGRILGDFSGEDAIVSIYSQFEANGTSYIAMEYLEGRTLKQAVEEDGQFRDRDIFQKCIPLLATLGRIHGAGVIHRDISPDNIMLLPDGSLKLMDFGAAGVFDAGERTRSLIYKESYSPMEQLGKKNGRQGPWSDLFALSGTLYYCVTGTPPADAFQRALYDDLKKPSEIAGTGAGKESYRKADGTAGTPGTKKGGVSEDADRILMKGLELIPENRWASADELREEIERVWPVISPEEQARKKKRKRRIIAAVIAAAVCVIAALSVYIYQNSTRIRFRQITTQRVFFSEDEDDYTKEEFEEAIQEVRRRVEAWVGPGNYLLEKKDGGYLLTVPAESFGSETPDRVLPAVITRKMNTSLVYRAGEDDELEIPAPRDAFDEIRKTDTGLELVMTDGLAEKLGTIPDEAGQELLLAMDTSEFQSSYRYWNPVTEGDGKTLRLDMGEYLPFRDVLYYDLTTEPLKINMYRNAETLADWESADDSLAAGTNQVNHSELSGDCVRLLYTDDSLVSDITDNRSSYLSTMAAMKDRLDALGVSYAFGLEYYERKGFVVELSKDFVYAMAAEVLGSSVRTDLGTFWGKANAPDGVLGVSEKGTGVRESGMDISEGVTGGTDSGTEESKAPDRCALTMSYERSSEYIADQLEEILEKAEKSEDQRLYLYLNYTRIAWADAEEAKEELTGSGTISFGHWNLAGLDEKTADYRELAEFLASAAAEQPQAELNCEGVTGIYSENGSFSPKDLDLSFRGASTDYASEDEVEEFKSAATDSIVGENAEAEAAGGSAGEDTEEERTGGSVEFESTDGLYGTHMILKIRKEKLPDCADWLGEIRRIYENTGIENGRFEEVSIYMNTGDTSSGVTYGKGTEETEDGRQTLSVIFSREYEAGAMQISFISGDAEYEEAVNKILDTDEFYKKLTSVSEARYYVSDF